MVIAPLSPRLSLLNLQSSKIPLYLNNLHDQSMICSTAMSDDIVIIVVVITTSKTTQHTLREKSNCYRCHLLTHLMSLGVEASYLGEKTTTSCGAPPITRHWTLELVVFHAIVDGNKPSPSSTLRLWLPLSATRTQDSQPFSTDNEITSCRCNLRTYVISWDLSKIKG